MVKEFRSGKSVVEMKNRHRKNDKYHTKIKGAEYNVKENRKQMKNYLTNVKKGKVREEDLDRGLE